MVLSFLLIIHDSAKFGSSLSSLLKLVKPAIMLLIIWNEELSVARFQSKVPGSLPILILMGDGWELFIDDRIKKIIKRKFFNIK